jgi:hypothetical protein
METGVFTRPGPLAVIDGREMQISLATASVAMLISFRSSSAERRLISMPIAR